MATKKKTKRNAGETLVEVIASIFLFLVMMGIMQGAISYSRASLEKNKQIRRENAEIIQNLQQSGTDTTTITTNIKFSAVNTDMTQIGSKIVFEVPVTLEKRSVPYIDADGSQQTTTFCLYQSKDTKSGGNATEPAAGGDGS